VILHTLAQGHLTAGNPSNEGSSTMLPAASIVLEPADFTSTCPPSAGKMASDPQPQADDLPPTGGASRSLRKTQLRSTFHSWAELRQREALREGAFRNVWESNDIGLYAAD
jgi:hypothetical protein